MAEPSTLRRASRLRSIAVSEILRIGEADRLMEREGRLVIVSRAVAIQYCSVCRDDHRQCTLGGYPHALGTQISRTAQCHAMTLAKPDLAAVVRAGGSHGETTHRTDQFTSTFERVRASGEAAIILCVLDRRAQSYAQRHATEALS